MYSSMQSKTSLQNDPKQRKNKRNPSDTSITDQSSKPSVRDPKIIKQLIKTSEKHEIHRLVQDLLEEEVREGSSSYGRIIQQQEVKQEPMEEEKSYHPQKINVPVEFQEKFIADFKSFLEVYKEASSQLSSISRPLKPSFYEEQRNLEIMAKLYYLCEKDYYEANAIQLWKDLPKCFSEEELAAMEQDPKEFYKRHLFFFDRFSKATEKSKETLLEILKLQVDYLTDPYTVQYPSLKEPGKASVSQELLDEVNNSSVMKHQCALLKGFVNVLGIDSELFSLSNIVKSHHNEMVDVVFQNPDLYGFVQDQKKTSQYKKKVSLAEYSAYQRESMLKMPQHIKNKDGMIQFAVNVDFGDWKEHMNELTEKVPAEWLFDSEKDAMRFNKQKINGINLPQFFLKVEGAWTGGHEENLRLRAINLNHGPDSCVWYTVGTEHARDFRNLVKGLHNLDIHKDEGLWFGDIDLCIKNKIKIQYFVQEPGDIVRTVLLGPGCLHWVRCSGITMNSAWNVLSQDKLQFEKAFERYMLNKEINFKSIVPMRHISLELILKELHAIPADLKVYLAEQLIKAFDQESKIYNDFAIKHPDTTFYYELEGDSVYFCPLCNHETLNFYAYCVSCSKQKKAKNIPILFCLGCYEKHLEECKNRGAQTYLYFKLSLNVIASLKEVLKKIKNGEPEPYIPSKFSNINKYLEDLVEKDKKNIESGVQGDNSHVLESVESPKKDNNSDQDSEAQMIKKLQCFEDALQAIKEEESQNGSEAKTTGGKKKGTENVSTRENSGIASKKQQGTGPDSKKGDMETENPKEERKSAGGDFLPKLEPLSKEASDKSLASSEVSEPLRSKRQRKPSEKELMRDKPKRASPKDNSSTKGNKEGIKKEEQEDQSKRKLSGAEGDGDMAYDKGYTIKKKTKMNPSQNDSQERNNAGEEGKMDLDQS